VADDVRQQQEPADAAMSEEGFGRDDDRPVCVFGDQLKRKGRRVVCALAIRVDRRRKLSSGTMARRDISRNHADRGRLLIKTFL